MRSFSKYFSDALASTPNVEPHKFLQIHGTGNKEHESSIIVELKLSSYVPFDVLPALLFSVRSLYSSCADSRYLLFLIIDSRDGTLDIFHACARALHNFASRLQGAIERILWVGVPCTISVDSIIANDLTLSRIQSIFCDARNVTEHIDVGCLSVNLGGIIEPEIAEQFFRMRLCLENLLRRTHFMAKLYMAMHEDLKRFDAPNGIANLTVQSIHERMDDSLYVRLSKFLCPFFKTATLIFRLRRRWAEVTSEPNGAELLTEGGSICERLSTRFPMLEKLDPFLYKEAVKRAVAAFKELSAVMKKTQLTVNRRLKSFQSAIETVKFVDYFAKESAELETRLKGLEKLMDMKVFSVIRLSAQMKKVEELSAAENTKMDELCERLSDADRLLEECCWFGDEDRSVVENVVKNMREKIASGRDRVALVVSVMKKAIKARVLIDKLYDWALLYAKKQNDESMRDALIKQFPLSATSHLHQYLDLCSDAVIRQEIETLVNDCERAMRVLSGSEKGFVETDQIKCGQQLDCGSEGSNVESGQKASANLKYINASNSNSEENSEQSMKSETLISDASEAMQILGPDFAEDAETLKLRTNQAPESVEEKSLANSDGHNSVGIVCSGPVTNTIIREDGANGPRSNTECKKISFETSNAEGEMISDAAVVREKTASDSCLGAEMDSSVPGSSLAKSRSDLSDSLSDTPMEVFSDIEETLVASCSRVLNTEMVVPSRHRSVSPAPTQYEIPISKTCTSRMEVAKVQKEICDLDEVIRWRRNSWCSTINTDDGSLFEEHAIGAAPVTLNLTDKIITTMSSNTLHKRLDQRRSVSSIAVRVPNPFLINGAARPGSARFVSARSRPMLSRNSTIDFFDQESVLNAFQFLDDDYSVSGEATSCIPSGALSTLDFSMRSEQIDVIREWLNPAKTSDPNTRIECTVVRDLLDSEIDYVRTLRVIVQDFVPELARVDIPLALRGKKFRVFGNVERLFQFHAHTFLPQLISRLRFRPTDEPLSLTVGRLFVDHANLFNLYSLYAKNKPKSDELMHECGNAFFHSIQDGTDLAPLLVRPIERIGKYTLALQQLHNAAPLNKLEVVEILERAVNAVSRQIRHGSDLLAMEHITGCDLNLREQGVLLRNDTMLVTEKRGIHAKKRLRSVFLFENCVVLTKPKLCRSSKRSGLYDELRYKGSIQMTDCGLTEMVKDSKVKFELWFRKQTNSFTYVLEAQSPSVRDAWVADIRSILWKQAIRSREESLREKANMGMEPCASYIHLGMHSPMGIGSLRERTTSDITRRPRSLISLTASSCSSSNNVRIPNVGCVGCEMSDLCRVEESDETDALIDDSLLNVHDEDQTCSLPRFRAPPPPDTSYTPAP